MLFEILIDLDTFSRQTVKISTKRFPFGISPSFLYVVSSIFMLDDFLLQWSYFQKHFKQQINVVSNVNHVYQAMDKSSLLQCKSIKY